jgi:hypothetical protein
MVKRNPANHSVGEYGEIIMQWSSKTGKKICDVVEALNTGQANSKRNINSYKVPVCLTKAQRRFKFRHLNSTGPKD